MRSLTIAILLGVALAGCTATPIHLPLDDLRTREDAPSQTREIGLLRDLALDTSQLWSPDAGVKKDARSQDGLVSGGEAGPADGKIGESAVGEAGPGDATRSEGLAGDAGHHDGLKAD